MRTFDKASWHIDAGETEEKVINRFKELFNFLAGYDMLNDEGLEILEDGIDSAISLNGYMLNDKGYEFLEKYYDIAIALNPNEMREWLENLYNIYNNLI